MTQCSASCHTVQRTEVFIEQQRSGFTFCNMISSIHLDKNSENIISFSRIDYKNIGHFQNYYLENKYTHCVYLTESI